MRVRVTVKIRDQEYLVLYSLLHFTRRSMQTVHMARMRTNALLDAVILYSTRISQRFLTLTIILPSLCAVTHMHLTIVRLLFTHYLILPFPQSLPHSNSHSHSHFSFVHEHFLIISFFSSFHNFSYDHLILSTWAVLAAFHHTHPAVTSTPCPFSSTYVSSLSKFPSSCSCIPGICSAFLVCKRTQGFEHLAGYKPY